MADDLNALLEGVRGGGSLPAPAVLNPLAAVRAGQQAASGEFELRKLQAEQASGQAFLDSIQNGRPNQQVLLENLKNRPNSAFHAQQAAQAGQTLSAEDYALQSKQLGQLYSGGVQLVADHPNGVPREAALAAIQEQVRLGMPPDLAARAAAAITDDPRQNTQIILRGLSRNFDARTALDAAKPPQINLDVGGRVVPLQPTPQLSTTQLPALRPGAGVTTGASPGQFIPSGRMVWDGDQWVWQPGQVPASSVVPPGGQPVPSPGPVPPAGAVAPPTPPAPGTRLPTGYQPRPGQRSEISGGVQVAGAGVPATGEGSPPGPAVAGDVAAITAGMDNARATPGIQTAQASRPVGTVRDPSSVPFVPTGPPMGTEKTMDANREVANKASLEVPAIRDNLTATETALKALRLSNMASGPTSSWKATAHALLEANGLSPGDPTKMSETAWRQVAQKNLIRLAEGQAGSRTNMGLETQLHANPNMDAMLANANEHVLIQDLGRMRQRYVMNMTMPRSGGNAAIDHQKNYGGETDYRGFAWDMTSKAERDKILDEVGKDKTGKAKARLFKAIEDADEHHLLAVPEAPAKRPQGMLMPSPQINPLSPAAVG